MADSHRDRRPSRRDGDNARGSGRGPAGSGGPGGSSRPVRGSANGAPQGKAPRGGKPHPSLGPRQPRDDRSQREEKPRHDDPPIPDDVEPGDLDRGARAELKTLSKENGAEVARHLVMAARLIHTDPALAHRHALAAQRRGGRVGVVRETVGVTAYATGDFALALRELRTYRRLTGRNDQLPLMVDSERGVGRPERALELGRSVDRSELEPGVQVALAIAMSGARLDLGQLEAALTELRIPQLDPDRAYPWSPLLFDAYATVLEDLGRADEGAEWRGHAERAAAALDAAANPPDQETVEVFDDEED